jgi:hypothetical protein
MQCFFFFYNMRIGNIAQCVTACKAIRSINRHSLLSWHRTYPQLFCFPPSIYPSVHLSVRPFAYLPPYQVSVPLRHPLASPRYGILRVMSRWSSRSSSLLHPLIYLLLLYGIPIFLQICISIYIPYDHVALVENWKEEL